MFLLTDKQADQVRKDVAVAMTLPDALEQVRAMYRQLAEQTELRRPRCDVSGRCCRFEQWGHRLYVTTLELAAFGADKGVQGPRPDFDGTGCPFQIAGQCSVHPARPFGCRVYFCDRSSDGWQQDQYEHFQSQVRLLHEQAGVGYWYVEWRQGLKLMGWDRSDEPADPRRLRVLPTI